MKVAEMADRLVSMGFKAADLAPRTRDFQAVANMASNREKILSIMAIIAPCTARSLAIKTGLSTKTVAQTLVSVPYVEFEEGVFRFIDRDEVPA